MVSIVHGKPLGFKRDPAPNGQRGPRYQKAALRKQASAPLPLGARVAQDTMLAILNQLKLGGCVGNAVAEAVALRMLKVAPPKQVPSMAASASWIPSRLWCYYQGRVVDNDVAADAGTTFRSVFTGLNKLGFPDEASWPYDISKFAEQPPESVYRAAFDQRQTGSVVYYEAIDDLDPGVDLVYAVKAAIADGSAVCIGIDVSEAFCEGAFSPNAVLDPPAFAETVGGHAMVVVGYEADSSGATKFLVRNSWGRDWGASGYCWFSEAYVRTGDLWVVEHLSQEQYKTKVPPVPFGGLPKVVDQATIERAAIAHEGARVLEGSKAALSAAIRELGGSPSPKTLQATLERAVAMRRDCEKCVANGAPASGAEPVVATATDVSCDRIVPPELKPVSDTEPAPAIEVHEVQSTEEEPK